MVNNHVRSDQVPELLCKTLLKAVLNKSKLQETPGVPQFPVQLNYTGGSPRQDNVFPLP